MIKNAAKIILKTLGIILLILISMALGLLLWFNLPGSVANEDARLGITFSSRYATDIGLNWKENFTAVLDDLQIKKIRIPVYWDLIEPKEGEYNFADLDWQMQEAGKRQAEIILVVGQKVPRWPECFIPEWAKNDDGKKRAALLKTIGKTVERYKNAPALKYWQVENEPFLPFGICPTPTIDPAQVGAEVDLVRTLDPGRKIIVTDSGELSLWYKAASYADVFGTTMYRTIWKKEVGYFEYPIGPRFFQFKHSLVDFLIGHKEAIVIELQAEPWVSGWTVNVALSEQFKSMNPEQLRSNVEFAKQVGFPEIYLWGAEWWYWLKTTQNHPELWDTAKNLFGQNGK